MGNGCESDETNWGREGSHGGFFFQADKIFRRRTAQKKKSGKLWETVARDHNPEKEKKSKKARLFPCWILFPSVFLHKRYTKEIIL